MDQGLKKSKYNVYTVETQHDPGLYSPQCNEWQNEAVTGTPLYPDDTPGNPRLSRFMIHGCKDLWAALLFLGLVGMTICWGIVNMVKFRSFFLVHTDGKSSVVFNSHIAIVVLSLCGAFFAAIFCSMGYLVLLRMFPRQLIIISNVLTIVVCLGVAVVLLVYGKIIFGVISIILAALNALWLFLVRDRIPFSAELLKASSDILMSYKCVFVASLFMCAVSVFYFCFWLAMVYTTIENFYSKSADAGGVALMAFFLLVLFWFMQVVPSIMHVTTAGVTATWYFAGEGRMPKNPTLASFRRATTTSLGSICFGSLIIAIIELIRFFVGGAVDQENEFVRCIVSCIMSCIESIVEFINTYAFVHVAVYGCGYIEAAKRTWKLCKQCFFAAYFNDSLVGDTIALFVFFSSLVIGTVIGLINWSIFIGTCAFLIAAAIFFVLLSAVPSAVTTLFVCFAEVPEGLLHSAPSLYAALHAADQNGTNNAAPPL